MNVVKSLHSSASGTCQYPFLQSKVEKYSAFGSILCIASHADIVGCTVRRTCLFRYVKPVAKPMVSSDFTGQIVGLQNSVGRSPTGSMIPSASSFLISLISSSRLAYGTFLGTFHAFRT